MDELGAAAPSSSSKSPPSQVNAEFLQAVRALRSSGCITDRAEISSRDGGEKRGRILKQRNERRNIARSVFRQGNVQTIKPGVYVDLTTLLPRVKSEKSSEAGSGDAKRKVTIESFDQWLEAWSVYKEKLMAINPDRYIELAHYRSIIQKAHRKF